MPHRRERALCRGLSRVDRAAQIALMERVRKACRRFQLTERMLLGHARREWNRFPMSGSRWSAMRRPGSTPIHRRARGATLRIDHTVSRRGSCLTREKSRRVLWRRVAEPSAQHLVDHGRSARCPVPALLRASGGEGSEHLCAQRTRDDVRLGVHQQPAVRAVAVRDARRPAELGDRRLRQRIRAGGGGADVCPSSATSRLPDHARRQDALRRRRSVARVRGTADDRHLPGRLRLDTELGRCRDPCRLVVPQHGQRPQRRRRRLVEPTRLRRRGRLPRCSKAA